MCLGLWPDRSPTAGVLAPSDAVRAAWLFLLSLTVQGAAVALTPQYSGDQVIFGAPVADAFLWHRLGVEIAHGNGVETPLRPLYPIVLALFFQGLGYGLGVAKAVNVLLASLTVSLSYLVFRFAAPQGAATILALALAARPDFVLFSHSLLTEHAGLCFSMASLLALLLGMAGRRPTWWWTVSGLTMGLSTLARPLALFAVPLALVAGSLRLGRRAGLPFFCFLAALGLALAPWLIRQHAHYGIWTLSSNSSEAFYAATSPKLGKWGPSVAEDLIAKGLATPSSSVAEWHRAYVRGAIANLRESPGFYVANVSASLWKSLNDPGVFQTLGSTHAPLFAAMLLLWGAWAAFSRVRSGAAGAQHPVRAAAAAGCTAGAIVIGMASGLWSLLLATGLAWVVWENRAVGAVLGLYLLGNVAGHSAFGFSSTLDRVSLMYHPLVLLLQLIPFLCLGRLAGDLAARLRPEAGGPPWEGSSRAEPARPGDGAARRHLARLRLLVIGAASVLAVGSARLAWVNITGPGGLYTTYGSAESHFPAVLDALSRARPGLFAGEEAALALDPASVRQRAHGRKAGTLVIADTRTPFSVIEVPAAYARRTGADAGRVQIAYLPMSGIGNFWSLLPGLDMTPRLNQQFVVVARALGDFGPYAPGTRVLRPMMQVLALVPVDERGPAISRMIILG